MLNPSGIPTLIKFLVLTLGVLGLISCTPPNDQPLRVGSNLWPGYEPLYLARANHYYGDDVRLVEYPNATEVLRAFRNNSLEAAALTLDEVLVLRQYHIPATIILVTDISDGGDAILARPGISSMKQLTGKTVGVESGALGAYLISRAFELNDMSLSDITIAHMGVEGHRAAFEHGEVDAVVTFEPVRTQLLSAGANQIFSSKMIPGEIVHVIVVHDAAIKKHERQIHHMIDGWFKAVDDIKNKPMESAQTIDERLKLSPQEVIASYKGLQLPSRKENSRMLKSKQPALQHNIARLKKIMLNSNLLDTDISIEDMTSDHFFDAPE